MSASVFSISFFRSWGGAVAVDAAAPFPFLGVGDTEIKHCLVDLLTFSCFNKLNQFQLHLIFLTWCIIINNIFKKPVAMAEWVAHQTAEEEVGGSNPGIPPLLKHACGEGDWLLCWHYTLAKVSHQR